MRMTGERLERGTWEGAGEHPRGQHFAAGSTEDFQKFER